MLNQDTVREATRLTHGGQLVEATALLQHMLRGEREPTPASRSAAQAPLPRLEPPTIDAKADVVEERKSRQPTPVQGRTRPAPLVGMRKFSGVVRSEVRPSKFQKTPYLLGFVNRLIRWCGHEMQ